MMSAYKPSPSDFRSLIAAIQALDEKRIEASIERIARAAKRKPRATCAKPREISK